MSYYHECPDCGANLDPGEKCDCYKDIATSEIQAIFHRHGGSNFDLITAAYHLGYQKAELHAQKGNAPTGSNQ